MAHAGGGGGGLPALYSVWKQSVFPPKKQGIRGDAGSGGGEKGTVPPAVLRAVRIGGKLYPFRTGGGIAGLLSDLAFVPDAGDRHAADGVSLGDRRRICRTALCGGAVAVHPVPGNPVHPPGRHYGNPECRTKDGDDPGDQPVEQKTGNPADRVGTFPGHGSPPTDSPAVPPGDAGCLESDLAALRGGPVSGDPERRGTVPEREASGKILRQYHFHKSDALCSQADHPEYVRDLPAGVCDRAVGLLGRDVLLQRDRRRQRYAL